MSEAVKNLATSIIGNVISNSEAITTVAARLQEDGTGKDENVTLF